MTQRTGKSWLRASIVPLWIAVGMTGCASPYRSDQGALFGGLTGAGVGALVGNAVGSTGAGAAIGAGVGALSGAVVGQNLDNIEANNRALIESRLGRPVSPGAVSIDDVVSMSKSGVDPEVISTHVRNNGTIAPLSASDLVFLQQQGVSPRVVQVMQQSVGPAPAGAAPAPVMVGEYYYPPPYYYPYPYPYPYYPGPRYSVGFSFGRGGRHCR